MTEEKASVLCNFCNSSRYGCSSEGQDNEAVKKIKLDEDERLRKFSTSSSKEEREEKQDHEAPLVRACILLSASGPYLSFLASHVCVFLQLKMKREFERRSSEPVHKELERLWLLNE
ncbi:unnamed protein product [Brassica rapa subsp. trilocularis]